VTDLGDTFRDITDTADVSRASIAKGRRTVENITAADIAMLSLVVEVLTRWYILISISILRNC
jgi:hypothetical protein